MFQTTDDFMLANFTHRVGEVMASPTRLIEVFGKPMESDGYKSSGEYIFKGDDGSVFTLYDWKMTSLYDEYYESPQSLWSGTMPIQFNIGGKSDPGEFQKWLISKLIA